MNRVFSTNISRTCIFYMCPTICHKPDSHVLYNHFTQMHISQVSNNMSQTGFICFLHISYKTNESMFLRVSESLPIQSVEHSSIILSCIQVPHLPAVTLSPLWSQTCPPSAQLLPWVAFRKDMWSGFWHRTLPPRASMRTLPSPGVCPCCSGSPKSRDSRKSG